MQTPEPSPTRDRPTSSTLQSSALDLAASPLFQSAASLSDSTAERVSLAHAELSRAGVILPGGGAGQGAVEALRSRAAALHWRRMSCLLVQLLHRASSYNTSNPAVQSKRSASPPDDQQHSSAHKPIAAVDIYFPQRSATAADADSPPQHTTVQELHEVLERARLALQRSPSRRRSASPSPHPFREALSPALRKKLYDSSTSGAPIVSSGGQQSRLAAIAVERAAIVMAHAVQVELAEQLEAQRVLWRQNEQLQAQLSRNSQQMSSVSPSESPSRQADSRLGEVAMEIVKGLEEEQMLRIAAEEFAVQSAAR